jgi:hypothetical protein
VRDYRLTYLAFHLLNGWDKKTNEFGDEGNQMVVTTDGNNMYEGEGDEGDEYEGEG